MQYEGVRAEDALSDLLRDEFLSDAQGNAPGQVRPADTTDESGSESPTDASLNRMLKEAGIWSKPSTFFQEMVNYYQMDIGRRNQRVGLPSTSSWTDWTQKLFEKNPGDLRFNDALNKYELHVGKQDVAWLANEKAIRGSLVDETVSFRQIEGTSTTESEAARRIETILSPKSTEACGWPSH